MDSRHNIEQVVESFNQSQKCFHAIGDETRQLIMLSLIKYDEGNGLRVGELMEFNHLSRSAISNHIKILKDAKILNYYREGTKTYYYLNPREAFEPVKNLIYYLENFNIKRECKQ